MLPVRSTLNPKPETRNPKPETRNLKPETRNPRPETRDPKPETRNPKPKIRSVPVQQIGSTLFFYPSQVDEFVLQNHSVNLRITRYQLLHRNVQQFRGGLVFKAHRLCVSLNSRLESNKEEEEVVTELREGELAELMESFRSLSSFISSPLWKP